MSGQEKVRQPRRLLRSIRSAVGAANAFWTSRPLILSAVIGLAIAGLVVGTERALTWMETPEFCSQCHTMRSEVAAHTRSPHQTVECTECHTGSGLQGFLKTKLDGMQQMVKLVTGRYARPIEAGHGMPATGETCLRCHNPTRQRGDLLITRSHFLEDQENTEQRVALVVRLSSDAEQQTEGIHWHVESDVEYVARDEDKRVIDWIGVERPDGTREEYISQDLVEISEFAGQQAEELRNSGELHRMTCYDCHNRVGHDFSTPSRAIDDALAAGRIDREIPLIKKRAVEVLSAEYASLREADQAIADLGQWYHQNYPNLLIERPVQLRESFQELRQIYRQTANPELQASPETYPSYLGHKDSAGCFRCHDGGHNKIEDGHLSDEAIPARCSLCHTFPSVGERAPNVMLGPPPDTHSDRLWIFAHKDETPSLDPAGTECSGCHSQTYCSNCHSTGATAIGHDSMLFDHAAVIRETTARPCSYCHQKPFCERCHQEGIDW